LLASRDVERSRAACSVSCTIVSVERVSVFEYCKDIRPRLLKYRRHVNTTFARVHTLTCHTVHVLRSLRIKHTSHRSRIPRSAPRHHRHCRRSIPACARPARRARQRWLRVGTCTVTPPPCCATASTQALDRPTNERPRGSPASPDARAVPPTRPARPLPRALAARRACCALLPRPHPCPLLSLPTADSACPACARNCCKERSFHSLLCCACNLVCTRHSQRAGYAGYAGYKARARATEDARPTVGSESHPAGRPRCLPTRCRRPRSRW
jgi:hypothetical protein